MAISAFALIFLTIYVGIAQLDALSVKIGLFSPVFGGAVTGLVMGDLKTGLIVGATLQLATLGVATYGGATVPDFLSGSIMGSAFAIMSGRGAAYGIGLSAITFTGLFRGQFHECYRFSLVCSSVPRLLKRSTLGSQHG